MYNLILADFTETHIRVYSRIWEWIDNHQRVYGSEGLSMDIYRYDHFIDYVVGETLQKLLECQVRDHWTFNDHCKMVYKDNEHFFLQVMASFIEAHQLSFLRGAEIKCMVTERDIVIARRTHL